MATSGTSQMSAEVKSLYDAEFYMQGQGMLFLDPLCDLKKVTNGERGQTVEWPLIGSLQPNTGTLDELSDVVAQALRVAALSVTLREYGGAVELTKYLAATAYSDVHAQAAYANGYNLAESLDMVVRAVAGQGSRFFYQGGRSARSGFAGITVAGDRITPAFIERLKMLGDAFKMPKFEDGSLVQVLHPMVHLDLLQNTNIRDMAIRQTPEMSLNGEVAYWSAMRIVVTANAKGFWGQGAALASSFSTTLVASADVNATNLKTTNVTNLLAGQWMAIRDAAEAGNTWSDTNELFYVTTVGTGGAGGTGVDGFALDPGPGTAGGLRYAHPSGTAVNNSNSVFPILLLGPNSLTKAASDRTGPYGESVVTGPFDRLGRFLTLGWYGILGYTRTMDPWIFRGEVGSSET